MSDSRAEAPIGYRAGVDTQLRPSEPPIRPEGFGSACREAWLLDPDIAFLNHGSFGAVPRQVLDVQDDWRRRIERRPVELLDRRMPELLGVSLDAAAGFVGADPAGTAFMVNATAAVNAVARSLSFAPGDAIVTSTHVYNAIRKTLQWTATRDGADYVEFDLALPIHSEDDLLERLLASIPPATRLLVIDQVSSPTGLVFPIERLLAELAPRGVQVMIDAAHAPGMLDVDVDRYLQLGAIAWTGNLHKWCFAPKGTAVLMVHPDFADRVQPTIISHHSDDPFRKRFSWQGTADFTPWLSVPEALAFGERRFGWDRLRAANHALATWAHRCLVEHWGVEPVSPLEGDLLGSIATVRLPESACAAFDGPMSLQLALYDRHRIEVPVMDWGGSWFVRVSAQAYNEPEQYLALAEAVHAL